MAWSGWRKGCAARIKYTVKNERGPHKILQETGQPVKWQLSSKALQLTAVMVSMHNTKGSEVKYLESDKLYSFHSCPKRSCRLPMRVWL